MRDWKKIGKWLLLGLLLVLLGLEAVMETRYGCHELSITSTDTEKILRRAPEVSITEEDRALMAELMELSSVQELLESGESGTLSAAEDPDVQNIAGTYLGEENVEDLSVNAVSYEDGYAAYLSWMEEKQIFCLQVKLEGNGAEYYKLYAPKRGVSYENWDNERAQKGEVHRRWFAWLRDSMWKEGA